MLISFVDKIAFILYNKNMVGIVDYNAGNIKSVERAVSFLGLEKDKGYIISKNPKDLENADKIIFPGVGEAKYAMEQLKKTGFDSFLHDFATRGHEILGICLGSQIIFEHSEEGDTICLGLVKGDIKHFSKLFEEAKIDCRNLKIPQMGWNDITEQNGSSKILQGIKPNSDFYFVHSYVIQPTDKNIVKATTSYGIEVPAVIQSKNIFACQFHPEKSGEEGLKILKNFCFKNCTEDKE